MQKLILIILILATSIYLFGQSDEDRILALVKEGIPHHDSKNYDKAISKYKEALSIDKNSTLANYELAMTYSEIGKNKEAVKHANKIIKQKSELMVAAYMVKGNVLDMQGKTKKSIKLFKKAIRETEGHYLLHYNLGINYFKQVELDLAAEQMTNAIKLNPSHASSHLYLALSQKRKEEVVKTLLPILYFLVLEPKSDRAKNAYKLLLETMGGDVSVDPVDGKQINIVINDNASNPYQSTELMISLLAASKYDKDTPQLTKEMHFIYSTRTVLESLTALNLPKGDIWTAFYTPFYDRLTQSEHFESYCYYILHGSNSVANAWCENHKEELEEMFKWLNK